MPTPTAGLPRGAQAPSRSPAPEGYRHSRAFDHSVPPTLLNWRSRAVIGAPAARRRSSAERRDHLGREPLELLRVVDERVEQNQLGTGVRDRTDAGGALLGRAREDVF